MVGEDDKEIAMSSYIDADALMEKSVNITNPLNTYEFVDAILVSDINNAPHIDIVRCAECKYFKDFDTMCGIEHYCGRTWCSPYDWTQKPDFYVKEDDFCSYGERKKSE